MKEDFRHRREPVFNAPWPAMVLVAAILLSYAAQSSAGMADAQALRYGFAPADLDSGRLITLFTYQFLHGGWVHAITNAVWALAFAPPVSRLLSSRPAGVLAFFGLFLACGVLAGLGYALFHPHSAAPLVGASGAVAGLMGAASRLIRRPSGLAPLTDRSVIVMGVVVVVMFAVVGVIGLAPGMGVVAVAWQAHIAGYLAGLLLIGPVVALLGRGRGDDQLP